MQSVCGIDDEIPTGIFRRDEKVARRFVVKQDLDPQAIRTRFCDGRNDPEAVTEGLLNFRNIRIQNTVHRQHLSM
jgi:hypothetical protein